MVVIAKLFGRAELPARGVVALGAEIVAEAAVELFVEPGRIGLVISDEAGFAFVRGKDDDAGMGPGLDHLAIAGRDRNAVLRVDPVHRIAVEESLHCPGKAPSAGPKTSLFTPTRPPPCPLPDIGKHVPVAGWITWGCNGLHRALLIA